VGEQFLETPIMATTAVPYAVDLHQPIRRRFGESSLLVLYELTQACDSVCSHRRACAEPQPHLKELTTEQSLRLIAR
jgi:hypothetical protein